MSAFIVEGGHQLHGSITPQGAKNEALQLLCAVLLTDEEVVISDLPDILDVNNLISLLCDLGVSRIVPKVSTHSKPRISIWTFCTAMISWLKHPLCAVR